MDAGSTATAALPPSAKYILYQLEAGPLTRRELIDETGIPESTVDQALRTLDEHGLVRRDAAPHDARQRVITPVEEDEK